MAVKSDLQPNSKYAAYPVLKYHRKKGFVILLVSDGCGFIIAQNGCTDRPVGEYDSSWKHDDFDTYHGKITMENT